MNIVNLLLVLLSKTAHKVLRACLPLIVVEGGHHAGLAVVVSVHRASHHVRYIARLSIMGLLVVGKCSTRCGLTLGCAQEARVRQILLKLVILPG